MNNIKDLFGFINNKKLWKLTFSIIVSSTLLTSCSEPIYNTKLFYKNGALRQNFTKKIAQSHDFITYMKLVHNGEIKKIKSGLYIYKTFPYGPRFFIDKEGKFFDLYCSVKGGKVIAIPSQTIDKPSMRMCEKRNQIKYAIKLVCSRDNEINTCRVYYIHNNGIVDLKNMISKIVKPTYFALFKTKGNGIVGIAYDNTIFIKNNLNYPIKICPTNDYIINTDKNEYRFTLREVYITQQSSGVYGTHNNDDYNNNNVVMNPGGTISYNTGLNFDRVPHSNLVAGNITSIGIFNYTVPPNKCGGKDNKGLFFYPIEEGWVIDKRVSSAGVKALEKTHLINLPANFLGVKYEILKKYSKKYGFSNMGIW